MTGVKHAEVPQRIAETKQAVPPLLGLGRRRAHMYEETEEDLELRTLSVMISSTAPWPGLI